MAAKNSSRQGGKTTDNNGPKRDRKSRRNVIVMAGLLSSLSLTSVLLLVLAPAPLTPDRGLIALDEYETIFKTRVPFSDHWRYIYIHHSKTLGGSGGVDDHFVIGNGDGATDGAIQLGQFWLNQQAARPSGAQISNNCITICLVGDFDQHAPTSVQLDRLEGLVQSLRGRLGIDAAGVILSDAPVSPAGIGRHFPKAAFGQRLQR